MSLVRRHEAWDVRVVLVVKEDHPLAAEVVGQGGTVVEVVEEEEKALGRERDRERADAIDHYRASLDRGRRGWPSRGETACRGS